MDKKGLYRIAVLLLLLVNLAAFGVFAYRRIETYRGSEELTEAAREYLSELGIAVKSGLPKGDMTDREVITFLRDVNRETELAHKLTGSNKRISKGGQVYSYSGEKGDCTFLGGGELVISVSNCEMKEKKESAVKGYLQKWLSDAGFDLSGAVSTVTRDGSGWRMEITDTIARVKVCNEKLTVLVDQNGFLTLSGRWRIGSAGETMSSGAVSQATALTKYAASRRDWLNFTEIREIRSVYWLYKEQNGAVTLIPAFQIVTDQGSVVINAMTGEALGA